MEVESDEDERIKKIKPSQNSPSHLSLRIPQNLTHSHRLPVGKRGKCREVGRHGSRSSICTHKEVRPIVEGT